MRVTDVICEVTGSVSLHHVDDGAMVAAGDPILEVECMKVFFPVYAPAAGIVRHRVELGAVVGDGDVIAVIETPAG